MTTERNPDMLSEDAVRRLLARASELEATRTTQLSIDELRDVAREAGIAPSSFDQALAELRNRAPDRTTQAPPVATVRARLTSVALGALVTLGLLFAALLAFMFMRMTP